MKRNYSKFFILLLTLVLMFGTLTACGGGSTTEKDSTSLVIASDTDYSTMHPCDYSSTIERINNDQIYDTLLAKDKSDEETLIPHVAESWDISEDGKCYTFHLRDDVKFHNGTKLTAEDIAFSLDLYSKSDYQGAVVDGYDHSEIVDENTINIYTAEVYAPFLPSMAQMYIACKSYYDEVGEETFAQQPVGCGAYKFVNHEDGNKWTLEAFEDYYGGSPAIKTVTFKVISDVTTMGVGLRTGEIDFAEIKDPSIIDQLENESSIQIEKIESELMGFVAMNVEKEPYNNVKFRQAVNYAMNREDIVTSIKEGYAVTNSHLLTPNRLGYSAEHKTYDYNVEESKKLLAEAGFPEGTDLGTMYVAEQYKALAQVVQANLQDVGLTCNIEILEFNSYLKKLGEGDFGITCLQMVLEGDTQQMSMALCTDFIGMANNARYSDPEIDQWFKDAAATIDVNERAKIYEKIFAKAQEEAIYCVLYNPLILYAHNTALNVPSEYPLEGQFFIHEFYWSE